MDFWAYPYLIAYIAFYLFWLLKVNRGILFWLYLWQLKEYHWGRFASHFETAKGKSLFLNPLIAAKLFLLTVGIGIFLHKQLPSGDIFSLKSVYDFSTGQPEKVLVFVVLFFGIYLIEGGWTMLCLLKRRLIHPEITAKSALLIFLGHILMFSATLPIFDLFLGEMRLIDFAFAQFLLVALDLLLPIIVGVLVLVLQPLSVLAKNRTLAKAKSILAQRSDLVVIGITGSYGKSSTKEFLSAILESKYNILKTAANTNTEIGIAQTIVRELKPEHQVFVCEIGAVHKGRIKQVAKAIEPTIGILTGINQQHLGVFGSQQNIIDAKFELLEALPQHGIAIINSDSNFVNEALDSRKGQMAVHEMVFCSIREKKNFWAEGIVADKDHFSMAVKDRDGGEAHLMIKIFGSQNVMPMLLAMAAAKELEVPLIDAAVALEKTNFSKFGMQMEKNSGGINVLCSTYSSNPDGVMAHLDYLKLWPGKKGIVMPCLIELGKSSKEIHYNIGQKIAEVCEFAIVTTKERCNDIKKGARDAGMDPKNIIFCEKPLKLKQILKNRLVTDDVILLEGRLSEAAINAIKK